MTRVPDTDAQLVNEPVAMRRVRFVVAYDGSAFSGFAVNRDVVTVAGVLEKVLGLITRGPVRVTGAGRTDTGVHAWGQVISCDIPARTDLANLIRRVNSMCGPTVVVRSSEWASAGFHARFDAVWRHYRYTVLNTPAPSPFLADTTWHVFRPLLLPVMQLACDPLVGENDFTSFCRKPPTVEGDGEPSMKRRVMVARWSDVSTPDTPGLLRFDIRANAFCHQMVRSIVGLMIDVGIGKRHPGEIRGMMLARDRSLMPSLAPARGLVLWEVGYPEVSSE